MMSPDSRKSKESLNKPIKIDHIRCWVLMSGIYLLKWLNLVKRGAEGSVFYLIVVHQTQRSREHHTIQDSARSRLANPSSRGPADSYSSPSCGSPPCPSQTSASRRKRPVPSCPSHWTSTLPSAPPVHLYLISCPVTHPWQCAMPPGDPYGPPASQVHGNLHLHRHELPLRGVTVLKPSGHAWWQRLSPGYGPGRFDHPLPRGASCPSATGSPSGSASSLAPVLFSASSSRRALP